MAGIISFTLIIAFLLHVLIFSFIDTPKERVLKREIKQYEIQFNMISSRLNTVENVLSELEYRDDNIYRVIFEADPIPLSIREAGYGGIDKYRMLEGYDNSAIISEASKRVDKAAKKLYILSLSYDEITEMATRKADMLGSIPAIQPISNNDLRRIASGFGNRMHPFYKTVRHHDGIDFTAPIGTEVYATGNGVIERATHSRRGYGNHIVIDHGYGYQTLYAHLHKFDVREGQEVKRGELIGYVGNSGLSVAPHLHYEVIKDGVKINPVNFFHNDLSPEEYETVVKLANQAGQSLD